jgi:hypothetical protein
MRKIWLILPFAAALVHSSPSWAVSVYRWTDERGRVVFSDRPQEGRSAQKVEIESDAPAASAKDSTGSESRKKDIDPDPVVQAEPDAEQRTVRQKNCEIARKNLAHNQTLGRMYRIGPDGERSYLSDEEREQVLERSREDVKAWCDRD